MFVPRSMRGLATAAMCLGLALAPLAVASGCATKPKKATVARQKLKKKPKARKPPVVESDLVDYTLTNEPDVEVTSFFLSRAEEDGRKLPGFAFSATLGEDADERMFPEEAGGVDDVLAADMDTPIVIFVVTGEGAEVRNAPQDGGALLRTLPKGARVAALREGDWARIGEKQFVHVRALTVAPSDDAARRAAK